MKTTKKTTKKVVKPAYTVDLTAAKDGGDVLYAFTLAKVEAGQPITKDEFGYALIRKEEEMLERAVDALDAALRMIAEMDEVCICEYKPKKQPWYKRFWNWIRRK